MSSTPNQPDPLDSLLLNTNNQIRAAELKAKIRAGTATTEERDEFYAIPNPVTIGPGIVALTQPHTTDAENQAALERYARRIEAEQREEWAKGTDHE